MNTMNKRNHQLEDIFSEIRKFISNEPLDAKTDIFKDLGLVGDDFHELIEQYQNQFNVNMDSYIWYFHADEEGLNFPGALFFKPPYERVTRIPVTPELLLKFANSGTWELKYPEHQLPNKRHDLQINTIFFTTFFILLASLLIYNFLIK